MTARRRLALAWRWLVRESGGTPEGRGEHERQGNMFNARKSALKAYTRGFCGETLRARLWQVFYNTLTIEGAGARSEIIRDRMLAIIAVTEE